ncbi:hypothetical protein CAP35_15410 [Chitinophagaceae bacterium IBVUCB1]|nr:hypothetical protein CAP35_15410 [Chitinophagaceae bacterium IBVUCB1]
MQWAVKMQAMQYYALCLLVFFIPFPFLFGSYTIALLVLLWLLQAKFKQTLFRFLQRKWLWPWVLFFIVNAFSYLYSSNKEQSLFDIGAKASLLLLPIIIGAGQNISRKWLERIFLSLNYSISFVALFCIVHAVVRCYQEGYIYAPFFFYHKLVDGFDASAVYMALYTLFSISIMLLATWKHYYIGKWRVLKVVFIVWQLIFFIMLSSRLLILLFFALLVPFYIRKAFKHRKWGISKLLIIGTLFLSAGIAVFVTDNPVKRRYHDIFQKDMSVAWLPDYKNVPQDSFNNVTLRLMLWRFGYEIIQENNLWLLGAGNGDATDLQNEKLAQYGFDTEVKDDNKRSEFYDINLHNMFFEALLMVGIIGLFIYVLMVFPPLFFLKTMEYRHVVFIFHVSMLFFMFQEAILQTQAGIVFYTLFSSIFWNIVYSNDNQLVEK